MAPLPYSGTIGATSATNVDAPGALAGRRVMPEPVTVFGLPTEKRNVDAPLETDKRASRRKRHSERDAKTLNDEQGAGDGKHTGEKVLSVEDSLVLLQSLRQSRLVHLAALLPYLSTRHRTATRYHPPPQGHPYPGGLDPSSSLHSLSHLGRADVRIGPLIFPRTRFGEARVEGGVSEAEGKAILKGEVYKPEVKATSEATEAAPPAPSQEASSSTRTATPTPSQTPKKAQGKGTGTKSVEKKDTPLAASSTEVSPAKSSVSPANTIIASGSSKDKEEGSSKAPRATTSPGTASASGTGATTSTGASVVPNINSKVVQAVSAAAARNPALQQLLQAAANGKATPDQLRHLANFIATVSEGLEKAAREAATSSSSKSTDDAGTASAKSASTQKKGGRKSKPDGEGKESSIKTPKKSAKKGSSSQKNIVSPLAPRVLSAPVQSSSPWYPPIVTVEFRENPSARFVLPLWRGSIVERRVTNSVRSIKVTMLLPAIGSAAAVRATGQDPVVLDKAKAKAKKAKAKAKAKEEETAGTDANEKEQEAPEEGAEFSPAKPPSLSQLRAPCPQGAETHAVTWHITASEDGPITDSLWNIFGRVEDAKTIVDGVEQSSVSDDVPESSVQPSQGQPSIESPAIAAIIKRLHETWRQHDDGLYKPKLQLSPAELSKDLVEHLADRFAPKEQILYSRPVVRLKRGAGGEEDDVEVLRSVQAAAIGRLRTSKHTGATKSDEEDEEMDEEENAGDMSLLSTLAGHAGHLQAPDDGPADKPTKPKRKRHVAKFNPDGTIKLCQACGTNATPMWRRGPAGKSTLCNACGAKWKVGRLTMPDQPPTASPGALRATQEEMELDGA